MALLIMDDEITDCRLMQKAVETTDYDGEVIIVNTVADGKKAVSKQRLDLALIDVLLPDSEGYKIVSDLDEKNIPFIVVSSRNLSSDVVYGLSLGAEDYVKKPFDVQELGARINRVIARRRRASEIQDEYTFGGLTVNNKTKEILYKEVPFQLTPLEYKVTRFLLINNDRFLTLGNIAQEVWGDLAPDDREGVLRTTVSRVRKKLRSHSDLREVIMSKWGRGYRMVTQTEEEMKKMNM